MQLQKVETLPLQAPGSRVHRIVRVIMILLF